MNLVVGAQSVLKGDGGPAAAQAETAVQTNKTFLENLICLARNGKACFHSSTEAARHVDVYWV